MRAIAVISFALLALGWVAVSLPADHAGPPPAAARPEWRRTATGWERAYWDRSVVRPYAPAIHPLVVAGFQCWLIVAAFCIHAWQTAPAARATPNRPASSTSSPTSPRADEAVSDERVSDDLAPNAPLPDRRVHDRRMRDRRQR